MYQNKTIKSSTAAAALVLLAGMCISGAAMPGAKGDLTIDQVLVDPDTDTITITGVDFNFKNLEDLVVTLGDGVLVPADITADCLTTLPTSDTIVCDLSGGGLPAGG
jgi:hypothetical protein